jgi:hypothetical protein
MRGGGCGEADGGRGLEDRHVRLLVCLCTILSLCHSHVETLCVRACEAIVSLRFRRWVGVVACGCHVFVVPPAPLATPTGDALTRVPVPPTQTNNCPTPTPLPPPQLGHGGVRGLPAPHPAAGGQLGAGHGVCVRPGAHRVHPAHLRRRRGVRWPGAGGPRRHQRGPALCGGAPGQPGPQRRGHVGSHHRSAQGEWRVGLSSFDWGHWAGHGARHGLQGEVRWVWVWATCLRAPVPAAAHAACTLTSFVTSLAHTHTPCCPHPTPTPLRSWALLCRPPPHPSPPCGPRCRPS